MATNSRSHVLSADLSGELKLLGDQVPAAAVACNRSKDQDECLLELETKVHEFFTITEKAPTRAFSLLKASTSAFTFKNL